MSEMQRLVLASEQYLTEHADEKESDSEGSSQMSSLLETEHQVELRHSDSLLLLTQGHKVHFEEEMSAVVRSLEISGDNTESSDTDSLSTPTSSPSHNKAGVRPTSLLKPSDSSFGLHSPDNVLPAGCRPNNSAEMKVILRKIIGKICVSKPLDMYATRVQWGCLCLFFQTRFCLPRIFY
jgi:hypothetical protein